MTNNDVEFTTVGSGVEMMPVGNLVEMAVYDVFTNRYMITQFQIGEENKEVRHDDNNA